ncbi:MAG TPA: sulfate ABC transporter permease subunit [Blastocatellia bacterium]|nr:sulfate ABC transporter permease subunit [Blastocatellia bacterium]
MSKQTKRRHSMSEWALIGAVVLYAAVLLVGPLVSILWGALSEGAAPFVREITSPNALNAIKLTLLLSVGATVLNTVFGVCIAWVLVRDDFKGRQLINGLVDLPFAVSPVIAGLMLILLFGRDGWFTWVTDSLGIKMVFAWPGMLLATAFVSLPFVTREVMPVLAQIGTEQENAAYTMGASSWQAFWHVTLPSIRWGLLYGVSLTLARAIGEFGAVLVVSGGVSGLTETSTLFIFRSLDDRNYVGAYSMALVLALISFTILMLMEFFKNRTGEGR